MGKLSEIIERQTSLQQWLVPHAAEAPTYLLGADNEVHPDQHYHECLIVAGRRDRLSRVERTGIKGCRDRGVEIRTYDWLIEACVTVDRARSSGVP
jgi:hypothetical protein